MRQKPKPKRRTRGLSKIKKTEITRVAKGLLAAGFPVRGFEVDPTTGKFSVLVGQPGEASGINTWDEVKTNAEDAKRAS
jgi:hypothetical protein